MLSIIWPNPAVLAHVAASVPEPPSGSGGPVDTVYYVLASVALIGGFLLWVWRYLLRQRSKWIDEGTAKAESNRLQKENSEQLAANTAAIAALTRQMSEFITSVHSELNGLGKRVTRLEFFHARKENNGPGA